MGPMLTALVNLQVIENQLRKARKKLQKGQQAKEKQQLHITQLEAALVAKREEIKLTRLQSSKLELELKAKDDQVTRFRVALNTAKSNRDYSAMLTQLNLGKADRSKLEDQILALITQVEADQLISKQGEEEIAAERQRLQERAEQISRQQQALQSELDKLEQQYSQARSALGEREHALFKRLADRFDGEALAPVAELNARRAEYGCGGCYMSIPRELINSLMSRDEVVVCPNCGRILVLELNPTQQTA